ncbi:Ribosomal protein L28 [Candidatus Omnitrophus magneticus]|uniref:Large ribosomal subunit protein bL28 n=1 Tax=Candidatus Omnitrophus magneticus TaxID=1609969 RepID=A0A0F0CS85_9BACT|nr:Ribosomal protein L28 [Candidatus Omnitrophus magneticus]
MARECYICGKKPISGRTFTRRGMPKSKGGVGVKITGKTLRRFAPNLQSATTVIEGKNKKIKICAKCLKADKIVKA